MRKIVLFALLLPAAAFAAPADDFASRPEALEFAREFAAESDFTESELLAILAQAEYQQEVIDSITRPAERTLTWANYQDIFLTDERTALGIEFMAEHDALLDEAYERYGVPPEIVTAILGVETMYGTITGDYRVLDALATLTFDYPPRAPFFRGQLKAFIDLVHQEEVEAASLMGSYAGAMGWGQFISSSYLNYAVDFDGDGYRDIWNNPADAIGSIANYLAEHDWERDAGILYRIEAAGAPASLFNVSLEPIHTAPVLEAMGLGAVPEEIDREELLAPIRLEGKQGEEFWLGLHNFYVITRYNISELYAMAVYQLSESLR